MNAYYNNKRLVDSNNDIIEAYFTEKIIHRGAFFRALEWLLALVFALIGSMCSAKARRIYRASAVALSLVGMIGVIGAMESGALGMGMGLLIGALFIGVELLALRHH